MTLLIARLLVACEHRPCSAASSGCQRHQLLRPVHQHVKTDPIPKARRHQPKHLQRVHRNPKKLAPVESHRHELQSLQSQPPEADGPDRVPRPVTFNHSPKLTAPLLRSTPCVSPFSEHKHLSELPLLSMQRPPVCQGPSHRPTHYDTVSVAASDSAMSHSCVCAGVQRGYNLSDDESPPERLCTLGSFQGKRERPPSQMVTWSNFKLVETGWRFTTPFS